jgi:hypothetical protein
VDAAAVPDWSRAALSAILVSNGLMKTEFEQHAAGRQASIAAEFVGFLRENKKFWLAPIVATLLLFGALIALGGSSAAPFIYSLF